MPYDLNKLASAIPAALAAAQAADPGEDNDGGACNFDSVYVEITGLSKEKVMATLYKAGNGDGDKGFRLFASKPFGKRVFFLNFDSRGQGNRKTAMAEAACKYLKESGIDARMYYRMD